MAGKEVKLKDKTSISITHKQINYNVMILG